MCESDGSSILIEVQQELVEGNTWGDKVWGVCDGVGENNLGKTLMRIRDALFSKRTP